MYYRIYTLFCTISFAQECLKSYALLSIVMGKLIILASDCFNKTQHASEEREEKWMHCVFFHCNTQNVLRFPSQVCKYSVNIKYSAEYILSNILQITLKYCNLDGYWLKLLLYATKNACYMLQVADNKCIHANGQ